MCDWQLKRNLAGLGSFLATTKPVQLVTVSVTIRVRLGTDCSGLGWPLPGEGRLGAVKGSSREPRRRPSQQPAFSNQLSPEQKRPCRAPETVGQTCLWTKQGHSAAPELCLPPLGSRDPTMHAESAVKRGRKKRLWKAEGMRSRGSRCSHSFRLTATTCCWLRPRCRLEVQKPCHTRARGDHGEPVTQGQTMVGNHEAFVSSFQQLSRRNALLPFLRAAGRWRNEGAGVVSLEKGLLTSSWTR